MRIKKKKTKKLNKEWFICRSNLTKLLKIVRKKLSLYRMKLQSCEEKVDESNKFFRFTTDQKNSEQTCV